MCRLFFRTLEICKVLFESASDTSVALLVSEKELNLSRRITDTLNLCYNLIRNYLTDFICSIEI